MLRFSEFSNVQSKGSTHRENNRDFKAIQEYNRATSSFVIPLVAHIRNII